MTGALAALDIALWDLKGKLLGQPVYKLLGGAWRTSLPFYASIGGNAGAHRRRGGAASVEARWSRRRSPPRSRSAGTATARSRTSTSPATSPRRRRCASSSATTSPRPSTPTTATRSAAPCASAARSRTSATPGSRSRCSTTTSRAMGEVAQRLDITVSAGEQTYTLQGLEDLINAGVRMVQPDIVKMGGITGLMQCAAICARARRRAGAAPDPAVGRPRRQPACAVDHHAPHQARRACRQLGRARCAAFENPSEPAGRPLRRCRRRRVSGSSLDEAEMKTAQHAARQPGDEAPPTTNREDENMT